MVKSIQKKILQKKYKVQFTPTLIFFNEEGKQILRLNGYLNMQKFNTALDYVKDKREKLITFKEYLVSEKKDLVDLLKNQTYSKSLKTL